MLQMPLFADDPGSDREPAAAENLPASDLDHVIDCLTWAGSDSACEAALVFPGASAMLPIGKRHNLVTRFLVKMRSRLIWCIEANGGPVNAELVSAIAVELHSGEDVHPSWAAAKLKGVAPFRISHVRPADINDFDVGSWPVRQFATRRAVHRALHATMASSTAMAMATDADLIAQEFSNRLHAALVEWQASSIDQHAFAIAQRHPENFAAVYRYLVQGGERNDRRAQAAIAAPFFVEACALTTGRGNMELLRIIDSAAPVLKTLETLYEISPATVRCMNKADLSQVGHWLTRPTGPYELARFLDRLPADLRPTSAGGWHFLERLRAQFFEAGGSLGQSTWGQIWARDMLRRYNRDPKVAARFDPAAPGQVETMRDGLISVVRFELGLAGPQASERAISTIRDSADECLWDGRTAGAWAAVADRWQGELESALAATDELSNFLRDGQTFNVVPEGSFVASSKERTIRALRSRDEIRKQGVAMANCLADTYLRAFERACKTGLTYVLGLYGTLGQPLSTAELQVSPRRVQGRWEVNIAQHFGYSNSEPSPRCTAALDELVRHLNCNANAQRHIGLGVLARRSFQPRGASQRPAQLLAQMRAFQKIGDGLHDRVLALSAARLKDAGQEFTPFTLMDSYLDLPSDPQAGGAATDQATSNQGGEQ